jgi:hypothetical protein
MLVYNSNCRIVIYFYEHFFGESLLLALCCTYRLSSLQTPARPLETFPNVWCVQCCLQPNEWPLLQATGYRLVFLKNLALLCSFVRTKLCGEGRATQMSLSASDVTNRIRVPYRLQLDFVAVCTAWLCLYIQLSFNCEGSVMFVQWIYLFCCEASYVKADKHSLRIAHPLRYLYFWMRMKSTRAYIQYFAGWSAECFKFEIWCGDLLALGAYPTNS